MTFVIWLGKHGHNTVWSKFDDSCGPNIMPQQFDFSKSFNYQPISIYEIDPLEGDDKFCMGKR